MTKQHDFKQSIRERMQKTGERYTAARAMLLQGAKGLGAPSIKGLCEGYTSFGGVCRDTGALRNALVAAGVTGPHTGKALSEAVVTGLCGGVGFLYAAFEYKGMPPMLSIMCRYDTMPDGYIAGGVERLGLRASVSETTSAATARKALDAALAAGKPAVCVVDCVGLAAGEGGPMQMAGMAPTVVTVAGVDGDELLIDDGGVVPRRMTHEAFAKARGMYKKGKNKLMTLEAPKGRLDVAACVRAAVKATADRYFNAPFKGFASNFGMAGLEKWRRLLTDEKDKKAWAALFPEGRNAYLALRRTYDGIEQEFTAPAAGRPMYAEFLGEAAGITGEKGFLQAAAAYRAAGERWRALTDVIASCGDAAVEKGCTLGDSAREMIDEMGCLKKDDAERIGRERTSLAQSCALTKEGAAAVYAKLAGVLDEVVAREKEAVQALRAVVRR